jgi:hypothetical protein
MHLSGYTKKLLALAQTLHRWAGALGALDRSRREKVAQYADEIAATLARASGSLLRLEADPGDRAATREALREFGRIAGYIETIVGVLQHHLDGRKLAGVKRRLEQLAPQGIRHSLTAVKARAHTDRLIATEGYFRALADSLRA